MCISSQAPSRKRQTTVRFTEHSRIVGPQRKIFFMQPFWCQEFGGGTRMLGKFVHPDLILY